MILFSSCELVCKSKQHPPFPQHTLSKAISCYKRVIKGISKFGSHGIRMDVYGVPLPLHLAKLLSNAVSADPGI